jgi:anti-sigma regulatory factor (Ser/Thr protein kinase)
VSSATKAFRCDISSPNAVRKWARGILTDWRVPSDAQHDVLLALSELAANAVLHARSDYLVVLRSTEAAVGVAVGDSDPGVPEPRSVADDSAKGGRGLHIVEAVGSNWGTEEIPDDGKFVWVQVPR